MGGCLAMQSILESAESASQHFLQPQIMTTKENTVSLCDHLNMAACLSLRTNTHPLFLSGGKSDEETSRKIHETITDDRYVINNSDTA